MLACLPYDALNIFDKDEVFGNADGSGTSGYGNIFSILKVHRPLLGFIFKLSQRLIKILFIFLIANILSVSRIYITRPENWVYFQPSPRISSQVGRATYLNRIKILSDNTNIKGSILLLEMFCFDDRT